MTTTGVPRRRGFRPGTGAPIFALAALTAAVGAGCGGANMNSSSSPGTATPTLPAAPAAGKFNSYLGSQGAQTIGGVSYVPQGGLLSATLDDSADKFTWQNTTNGLTGTVGGPFSAAGSFQDLDLVSFGTTNGSLMAANPEYSLEIPDRAVLMRPGDSTIPLAFLVPSVSAATATCQVVNHPALFQFVTLPDPTHAVAADKPFGEEYAGPAYGVVTAVGPKGTYNFSGYNTFYLNGNSTSPAPLQAGLCAQTLPGAAITIPADKTNNVPPTTVEIGPTGFLVMDQTEYQQTVVGQTTTISYGNPAAIGVIQPSSALDAGAIAGGKYLGFKFEPALEGQPLPDGSGNNYPITMPVAFGVTAGSAGTLVGGVYPNDDPTQTAAVDTTITLGAQAGNNPGLFSSAKVTVPDPNGVCAANGTGTVGSDGSGNPTCTFPAILVAGNPENKFALFLIANDFVNGSAMGIYLFQQ